MNRYTKVLALVMAGGKGTRLEPLTRERAKPSVPFGGKYKLVDFVLSEQGQQIVSKVGYFPVK